MSAQKRYDYINSFLYFSVRPYESGKDNTLIYCSGVHLFRFLPITKGRHGLCSNPAMRGLQIVNHEVRSMALSKGATPKSIQSNDCDGIVPPGHGWYREMLVIENAPEGFAEEVIKHCALELLRKINKATMLGVEIPEVLPEPDELQSFIEELCSKYGR